MRIITALSLIVCCCTSNKSSERINNASDSTTGTFDGKGLLKRKEKEKISYVTLQLKLVSKIDCTDDKTSCAQITISYPEFVGLSNEVRKKLKSLMAKSFVNVIVDAERVDSLQQVAENYIRFNEQELYKYPGERAWLTANILVELLSDSLLSLSVNADSWGYAHYDNRGTVFVNFNPKNGEKVNLTDVLDEEQITKLISALTEKIYVKLWDLSPEDTEGKKELLKEISTRIAIHLKHDAFGFSEKGFLFFYTKELPFILIPYETFAKGE